MFLLSFPFKKPPHQTHLKTYLKQVKGRTVHFTNEAFEGKLVCTMCRYLSGKIADINTILELAEDIRKQQGKMMNSELSSMTTILHHLSQKLQKKEIDINDEKTIRRIINKTQHIVTGKSFLN
jgi:hypothetical protein